MSGLYFPVECLAMIGMDCLGANGIKYAADCVDVARVQRKGLGLDGENVLVRVYYARSGGKGFL